MSEKKPSLMWHADPGGRCHRGCEQRGLDGCKLLDLVPIATRTTTALVAWEVCEQPTRDNVGCPFAVLADVLCLHQNTQEQDIRTCLTCGRRDPDRICAEPGPAFPRCKGWKPISDPAPKPDEDRRCGTCTNGDLACRWWPDGFSGAMRSDGPPWPNCRFWVKP